MKRILKRAWLGWLFAVVGAALMIFGIARGETAIVMQKALNLCLECVGIG